MILRTGKYGDGRSGKRPCKSLKKQYHPLNIPFFSLVDK
jgi:hypothetical protein